MVKPIQLNLNALTPTQREALRDLMQGCDSFRSSGFQEVLGYRGRLVVVSMGGYWAGERIPFFTVESFGGKANGRHIYTDRGGVSNVPVIVS